MSMTKDFTYERYEWLSLWKIEYDAFPNITCDLSY